jgi:ectoine hydroxylase-related dioxygenase (phytanoyl-CoA dioxygenase family)
MIQKLSKSEPMIAVAREILGESAKPVRGILFDKTPAANWLVPWHQDLSIAVKERVDMPGFGPWSEKAGVVHVQPPVDVLHQMVTIRLHLDDCTIDNGPLRVVPGTHHRALTPAEIAQRSETGPQITCTAPAGGAVVMRPLILHASSPAKSPAHRRVVHIEYAACDLPGGLEWHALAQ